MVHNSERKPGHTLINILQFLFRFVQVLREDFIHGTARHALECWCCRRIGKCVQHVDLVAEYRPHGVVAQDVTAVVGIL